MSIDDITLTPALRRRLYKNNITNLTTPVAKKHTQIPFKGLNKRHVLIAVEGKLKKEASELVQNLMKACQLSMDDVAFIDAREQEASLAEIIERLRIEKAILFGIPTSDSGLPFDEEEKIVHHHGCSFLRTAPPETLKSNEPKKRALWNALKMLFEL